MTFNDVRSRAQPRSNRIRRPARAHDLSRAPDETRQQNGRVAGPDYDAEHAQARRNVGVGQEAPRHPPVMQA